MTDLEKRAEKYCCYNFPTTHTENMEKACVEFAKQETELLSKHILELLVDKGRLTDEVNKLEDECGECGECIEHKTKQQLIEAKKIIRELLSLPYANDWEVYAPVSEYLSRAEAFLKE